MSDARKPKMKEAAEDAPLPKLDVENQPKRAPDTPLSPEQSYLQRKAEVARQDHEVFSEYLQEKIARDQQQKVRLAEPPPKVPPKVNRRSLLTWAAGTAVVGEAVTLGYPMVTGQSIPAQELQRGGGTYTEAQRHPIDREFVNPKADVGGRNFGSWVLLMPTKLGGGTYAVNLETGRALAWISYWNYGDYNPISHHLCAPMGELFVEEGTIPGDDVHGLCGADGTIWHPSGRWASTVVRLCGGQVILDAEKNFEPVAFLQFNKDAPNQYPIKKIDNDHWEVTFDKIFSPGHEIGFSPDGRFLCMMNNLRENNCSVFDSSDPDPRNWKKIAHIEDPLWVGKYPNPFHMVFSMDGSKLYLSILHPSPAASGIMVVDTKTWKIKKEIQGIGPDMQTLAVTYDGKYLVGVFSGFQRLSSGIAFVDTETDELVGIWPSNGGHHDCVIVPRTLEHMKHTRSCTL